MNIIIFALNLKTEFKLWNLTTLERLLFTLNSEEKRDITIILNSSFNLPKIVEKNRNTKITIKQINSINDEEFSKVLDQIDSSVILLNGNYVYDPRCLRKILNSKTDVMLYDPNNENAFGVKLYPDNLRLLQKNKINDYNDLYNFIKDNTKIKQLSVNDIPARIDSIKKDIVPFIIRLENKRNNKNAEKIIFNMQYKGVMDIIYMYLYRPVVEICVKFLSKLGVHPNSVSIINIFIGILAIPLFLTGHFLYALILTLITMIMDAIDGPLARLTFKTSKLGHYLDKITHMVLHISWLLSIGFALSRLHGNYIPIFISLTIIAMFFIFRGIRSSFRRKFHRSIYDLSRFDIIFRSISGNRWNINMIFLFSGIITGDFLMSLYMITIWNGFCLLFYATRFIFYKVG
ncbi:MAG: CDP-alcohol phosphatidyltransferase family protein [Spirochaetota bacterium]|nr:CDP-alcohol phosphatidyltransferase family protein [Spirochaetota bacterium]